MCGGGAGFGVAVVVMYVCAPNAYEHICVYAKSFWKDFMQEEYLHIKQLVGIGLYQCNI